MLTRYRGKRARATAEFPRYGSRATDRRVAMRTDAGARGSYTGMRGNRIYKQRKRAFTTMGKPTNGNQGVWIQRSVKTFPNIAYLTSEYVGSQAMATAGTATSYARYQFRMNSLYDPDYTGGGHQPYQWDQVVAAGYTQFVVYRCDWEVLFYDPSVVDSLWVCAGVQADSNTGADPSLTTVGTVAEKGWAAQKYVSLTGNQTALFKGSTYLPKLMGVTYAVLMANNGYWCTSGANPTSGYQGLLNTGVCDPAGNAAQGFINCMTKLKFYYKAFSMVSVTTS